MSYQETTDATSRKINMGFATDKTVNRGKAWTGTGAGIIELYKPMRDLQRKGEQGGKGE